jgi:hypothetical protein
MDESTLGLSAEQLTKLLRIGRQTPRSEGPGESALEKSLRATLSGELLLDVSVSDSLPAILCRPCGELRGHTGRSAIELLTDPGVDLAALRTLKDYAKELVKRGRSEVTRTIATVLYYAAIASALALHGERITQHNLKSLDSSLAQLLEEPWMDPGIVDLLERAREVCREQLEGERTQRNT